MTEKLVGFAISCRSGDPKIMWIEEDDPLDVALQGLERLGVDGDAIAALSGSRGVAKAVAVPWHAIFAPPPKR